MQRWENSNNIKTYKNKFKETMKKKKKKNDTFHGRNRNSILFNKIRIHNKIFKSNLDLSKKLLELNTPIEQIKKITGLSKEEIEKIVKK